MRTALKVYRTIYLFSLYLPDLLRTRLPSLLRSSLFILLLLPSVAPAATHLRDADMQNCLMNDRAGLARLNSPSVLFTRYCSRRNLY